MTKMIHSLWAYLVLILLLLAIFNAINGLRTKRDFSAKDLRISLFTMIVSHIQLVIGLAAYYMSNYYATMRSIGMGEVMKTSELRKPLVEHPVMIIIAVVLLTIGFSRVKRKETDRGKFRSILVYYSLALLLILLMIPWDLWFGA
jgi:heme A synthase